MSSPNVTKKRQPKALIIVENLPVPNDRRVWLEATTLRDAGYHVSVISIKGKNATTSFEIRENIHLYRYAPPPTTKGMLSFIFEFAYCWLRTLILSVVILVREGFDVIHACNPPETFWLIGLFYKLLGKKFLFDHHDLSPEMYFSRFGKQGIAYELLLLLERLTFMTADVVITTNETHKRVAIERGKFPKEKIFIVRSGPNHTILHPEPPDISLKCGKSYMVSYLGVLNPQDGVETFLQVAEHIVHHLHRSDIQFVVMGAGDSFQTLCDLSHTLGLDDTMIFTGWVEPDTIRRYLSTSEVCVDTMPKTPYSDAATMNKILEYMAVARPVVVFDLVETRISAQEAAVYARSDDIQDMARLIIELLEDPERCQRMGEYGRQRVEQELSWEHSIPPLLQAYAQVLDRK